MLDESYFKIPIRCFNSSNQQVLEHCCKTLEELKEKLAEGGPGDCIIEYYDDFGDMHQITDESKFQQALKFTNGQAHFFKITKQIIQKIPSAPQSPVDLPWLCPIDHFTNDPSFQKCKVCKSPKPKRL
jgi:hypothetical protein